MNQLVHILFVDDEPRVLQGLRHSLRSQRKQWEMSFANGGAEAQLMLQGTRLDVVVSDMRMPRIDGATVLTLASALQPEAVRVILSGQLDEASVERAMSIAHFFLSKPCGTERLIATIVRGLEQRSLLGAAQLPRALPG